MKASASAARTLRIAAAGLMSFLVAGGAYGASTLSVAASRKSPVAVGDVVTWQASVGDPNSSNVWYRFRVRYLGDTNGACTAPASTPPTSCTPGDFSVVRDFSPVDSLDWTTVEHEGLYEIETSARNNDTGAIVSTASRIRLMPRTADGNPVISETDNPLVLQYSAVPCPAGSRMRVEFQAPDGSQSRTPPKRCDGVMSMNFYLAGMRPGMQYAIRQVVENGSASVAGPVMMRTIPTLDITVGPYVMTQAPQQQESQPMLLHSRGGWPVATDLQGNLVWYYPEAISFLSREEPGGLFLGWYEDQSVDRAHQILREFDLAGRTTRETNAARVSEQLEAMGMHAINSFHHEVRALPGGKILALAASERILTDIQGPGDVDVLGDTIVVLDSNLEVLWAWDAFDHLDTHRLATLNETCNQAANGCAPIYLAAQANDWTHGNCVALTPDGNILYSARHQDWVIKIDYGNGEGSGDVLWRLGKDGDFQFVSNDPYPWFSHQHDPGLDRNGMLVLFDNGNIRRASDASAHSRGQVLQLDEENRVATLVLNADLGDYSVALGAAQQLSNGNYHFHLGFLPNNTARAVEVDPSGAIVYQMDIGELEYRSFRRTDIYSP